MLYEFEILYMTAGRLKLTSESESKYLPKSKCLLISLITEVNIFGIIRTVWIDNNVHVWIILT